MSVHITSIFIPGIYKTHSHESFIKQTTTIGDHLVYMYKKCIVKCTHKYCSKCINETDLLEEIIESVDEDGNILDISKSFKDYTENTNFTIYIYQKEFKPVIPINCEFIYGDKSYHFKYMYIGNYTLEDCCDDFLEYKCKQLVQIKKYESFAVKNYKIDDFMEDILIKSIDKETGEKSKVINLILSFINTSKYLVDTSSLPKDEIKTSEFFVDINCIVTSIV